MREWVVDLKIKSGGKVNPTSAVSIVLKFF
jgi:hypothetical protein